MEYPKIETLFIRDEATHKVTGDLRQPEFGLVHHWQVTEKIDGTNVRVKLEQGPAGPIVSFGGRTDNAQMPIFLLDYLQRTFDDNVIEIFDPGTEAILFGEGYGPKIQKGGGDYRDDVAFRLFDVAVFGRDGRTWWLNWDNVVGIAAKLGVPTVPVIGNLDTMSVVRMVRGGLPSDVAVHENSQALERGDIYAEGVVCRTDPLLFTRRGHRLVWKLKTRDF